MLTRVTSNPGGNESGRARIRVRVAARDGMRAPSRAKVYKITFGEASSISSAQVRACPPFIPAPITTI